MEAAVIMQQCVICCKLFEKSEAGEKQHPIQILYNCSEGSTLLRDHLIVYFVTRKLLKLSMKRCLQTVDLLSECPDGSFAMCQGCRDVVSKAADLHYKIATLEAEMSKLGSSLLKLVEESTDQIDDNDDGTRDTLEAVTSFRMLRSCLTSVRSCQIACDPPIDIVKEEQDLSSTVIYDDDFVMTNRDDFFLNDSTDGFWDENIDNDDMSLDKDDWKPKVKKRKTEDVSDSDSDYVPGRSTPPPKSNSRRTSISRRKYSSIKIDRKRSRFPCQFCQTVYTTPHGFRNHLLIHEKSDKLGNKFDCTLCSHPNLTEEKLRRHLTRRHESQKNTCKICGFLGHSRWRYEKHMLVQHNITIWTPISEDRKKSNESETETSENMKCEDNVNQDESMEESFDPDLDETIFSCKMCDSVYTTTPGFSKHMKAHKLSKLLGNLFDCKICRHPNSSERNLRRHMTKIHNTKSKGLNEKNKTAQSVVLKHEVIERPELSPDLETPDKDPGKTFNCNRCKSVFTTTQGIRKHERTHQESDLLKNQFDCHICGHPTTSTSNLSRHFTVVHNRRYTGTPETERESFALNPTSSTSATGLEISNEQEYSNIFEDPTTKHFRCRLCKSKQVYTSRPGILKHMRMHEESSQLGNIYDCAICGHPTTSEGKLRRHMTCIHPLEKSSHSVETINDPASTENTTPPDRLERINVVNQESPDPLGDGNNGNENVLNKQDIDAEWSPPNSRELSEESSGEESDSDSDSDFETRRKRKRKSCTTTSTKDLVFHCSKCNVSYKSARGFRTHQEEHKASIGLDHKYDCKKCGFPNSSERRLRYHIKRVHQEVPMCTCSICGYQAPRLQQFRLHMRKHNPSYKHRKGGRPLKYKEYINTIGEFECKICKVSYDTTDSLRRHMIQHDKTKLSGGMYDCEICNFPCTNESRLRFHKRAKHGDSGQPTCEICKRTFLRPNKLRDHMRTHEKYDKLIDPATGDYCCNICPFRGTFKGVIIHKNNWHKDVAGDPSDEPFLCSQCGLSFTSAQTLRQHVKNKHENCYRHTCKICGKGFEQKGTLAGHMKIHEEVRTRDFICSVCGVSYSHKKTLNEHVNRFHPENAASKRKEKEGRFTCKFCQTVFPFKYLLVNHIPSAHKDLYCFKCDACDKSYISASSLKLHREITHSDSSITFSCEYCGKTFPHKHYVICHYKFCRVKKGKFQQEQPGSSGTSHSLQE